MGITLERGRFVSPQDNESSRPVVDIDDQFAHTYFPNSNPIGQHIHIAGFDVEAEIIGVVGHIRQWGPGNDANNAIEAQFYYPFMQMPPKLMRLAVDGVAVVLRTHDDPAAIMGSVRKAVSAFDPGAVVYAVETMNEVLANSMAARRLSMILLAAFAALALTLSCIGMYGVLSYLAGERTREIGVRMALGATPQSVAQMVLRQASILIAVGLGVGLLLAFPAQRLIQSFLYQVHALDLWTYFSVLFVLPGIGLVAALLPARKAASIQPMQALRED
jgi:ABC-type antimicrobial peptide transport system permease subunit